MEATLLHIHGRDEAQSFVKLKLSGNRSNGFGSACCVQDREFECTCCNTFRPAQFTKKRGHLIKRHCRMIAPRELLALWQE
jgi:hypothetical protein